jgi:hypothetical protein
MKKSHTYASTDVSKLFLDATIVGQNQQFENNEGE